MVDWQIALIRCLAWLSFGCFAIAWVLRLRGHRNSKRRKIWYSSGWALLLIHVAAAFHWRHDWSHARALEATAAQSGYGDGIFANYALLLIWSMDVVWMWIGPKSYSHRPGWISFCIDIFLVFMWFWAATVFALWPTALIGWSVFILLGGIWWQSRRHH